MRAFSPQLVSLRVLAFSGVAWQHWYPQYTFGLPMYACVPIFFVLSGFLITSIILNARDGYKRGDGASAFVILRNFYVRRFLRIVPLYYAVMILATGFNVSEMRSTYPWHFLYASNYYFIHHQGWHGSISHFWTLAIEMQFYLLWPVAVFFMRRKYLPYFFLVVAAVTPLYRYVGFAFFPHVKMWYYATPGSFDCLGIGSFLAYLVRYPNPRVMALFKYRGYLFIISAVLFYFTAYTMLLPITYMVTTLLSVIGAIIVYEAFLGFKGAIGAFLDSRVLQYLGRISYGLYTIHGFAIIITMPIIAAIGRLGGFPGVRLLLLLGCTIGLASLSWYCYESPINKLKTRFPYFRK